jgi:methylglutaconyl-CoA hydratase
MMDMIDISIDGRGVACVRLNRPEVHNAFNAQMIAELYQAFTDLGGRADVRVIVLSGAGKSFSAGADLNWMRAAADQDEATNHADALKMADMFTCVNACPKPVIGLVQGAAMGGGLGLVAVCDMVIADPEAQFGLTEVRLGLIPAVISPFVAAKIGVSASRRYMLTGERFGADEARRIGLVSDVSDELELSAEALIEALLQSAPGAISDIKALIGELADATDARDLTARRIAARRTSAEGREGMAAFLERRKPGWAS